MSILTPRSLFRATALHGHGDPWIAEGMHLRVFASPLLGTPIHPFVAWRLTNVDSLGPDLLDVRWTIEGTGKLLPPGPFNVANTGPALGTVTGTNGVSRPPDWCFLRLEGDEPQLQVELLEGQFTPFGRPVTATRTRLPYAFGGVQLSSLRASGAGEVSRLFGIHEDHILSDSLGAPLIFGLPIENSPWYISSPGSDPPEEARRRLDEGQGKRFGPPDRPEGSFQALPPGDDVTNIQDQLGPVHIDPWLKAAFNSGDLPATVKRSFDGLQAKQTIVANLFAWDTLLTMTIDPRIARYLGFSTVLNPPPLDAGKPSAWLVAGQFALPQDQVDTLRQQTGIILQTGSQNDNPSWLDKMVQSRVEKEMFQAVGELRAKLKQFKWTVVTITTLAVAVMDAPPDLPKALFPRLAGPGQWNGSDSGTHWTQSIALQGLPPAGMVSFARVAPGGVVSLHQHFPETGDAARATALLANWSYQPPKVLTGFDPEVLRGIGGALWTPPILTDRQVPVDPAGATWRLWQADEFGRWSEQAEVSASLPERPLAPAPAPELDFQPGDVNGDQPASPGTLSLRIDVPTPQFLAPGALPIQTLEFSIDNAAPQTVPLADGQAVVTNVVAAPALSLGASTIVTVTARFRDSAGRASPDGQTSRRVFDPRPVTPNPTAPTILWTGRLDPTGKAELALMWNTPGPLARYRVYLGDERRLANALLLPPAGPGSTRAARAKAIYDQDKTGALGDKGLFTLLTEEPLQPDADGVVRFQYQIPGGLSGVQFMRIVPVTGAGVEAPFATCGLVPVAVPFSERPNAPTVRVTPVAGGVQVEVLAYGFTLETLAQYGYPASGRAPEYRVRRTRGLLTEAIYLPVVQQGTLTAPGPGEADDAPWMASFIDPEANLPSYVTHTWLAEVRYPSEPAQAEALAEPPPLAVRPLWGSSDGNAESLWSAPSLPAATTLVPAEPAALDSAIAKKQPGGSVKLSIANVPSADPKAIGSYQLAIWKWVKVGDGDQLADDTPTKHPLADGAQGFELLDDNAAGDAAAYSIEVIDPLGRTGPFTRVDVTE